jgi:hypothetical protein
MENVKFDPLAVEGRVKLELRDANTQKIVREVEGKNFLSRALTERILRIAQRYVFGHQYPNQWDLCSWDRFRHDVDAAGFFHWLVMTDSALAESPATEKTVPGTIIGYANRQTHSDTDLRRGIVNRALSHPHTPGISQGGGPRNLRWCFDFAHDRANGTIRSLCWTFSSPWGNIPLPDRLGGDASFEWRIWQLGASGLNICYYDGSAFGYLPDRLFRLNPDTGVTQGEWHNRAQMWFHDFNFNPVIVWNGVLFFVGGRGEWIYIPDGDRWGSGYWSVPQNPGIYRNFPPNSTRVATLTHFEGTVALIGDIIYLFDYTTAAHAHATGGTLTIRRFNCVTNTFLTNLIIPNLPVGVNTRNVIPIGGNIIRVGPGDSVASPSHWYDIDVGASTISLATAIGFSGRYSARAGRMKLFDPPARPAFYMSGTVHPPSGMLYDMDSMQGNFLLSRILLPSPIVKTSNHTLRVFYDFNFA